MLEALAALAKLLLYAGVLAGAGTVFAAASLANAAGDLPSPASRIIRVSAGIAFVGAVAHVFILILRLGGDFSGPTLSAVLDSPTGAALFCQLVGCVLLLAVPHSSGRVRLLSIAAAVILIASFGLSGHSASIDPLSGAIAATHVGAAAWWLGALLLLRPACRSYTPTALVHLVTRFSAQAIILVGCLVVTGAILILTLIDFNRPGWFSPYAQILAAKVTFAASLLGLAAYNKYRLTPELNSESGYAIAALRRSITLEITLIVVVLSTTSILTTYTSPHA